MELRRARAAAATVVAAFIVSASAQSHFNNIKPGTTGGPGEEVRLMGFVSAANLLNATHIALTEVNPGN